MTKVLFIDSTKPMNRDQESFITFKEPIDVSGNFFIGYKIKSATGNIFFSAFNLPKGETSKNTVWINYKGQWIEATSHPASPMSTSLFIDPVIQYNTVSANTSINESNPIRIFVETASKAIHVLLPETIRQARYSVLSMEGKNFTERHCSFGTKHHHRHHSHVRYLSGTDQLRKRMFYSKRFYFNQKYTIRKHLAEPDKIKR